jgi:hypothetical protein
MTMFQHVLCYGIGGIGTIIGLLIQEQRCALQAPTRSLNQALNKTTMAREQMSAPDQH